MGYAITPTRAILKEMILLYNEKEYNKQWRKSNPEKIKKYNKEYHEKHKKYFIEYHKQWQKDNSEKMKEYINQWYKANCERILENQRNRRKTDPKYNLNNRISCLMRQSLKGNKNGRYWENLIGYTHDSLMKHLKKTMPKGYGWNDFLTAKLHIDHIIPISIFSFSQPEHLDFKRCWALNNLRLLPAKENRSKYNKLTKPFQLAITFRGTI